MKRRFIDPRSVAVVLAAATAAACADSGPPSAEQVSINFQVVGATPAAPAVGPASSPARIAGPPMSISGSNGVLTIDEILLVVAEAELEGDDDACENRGGSDDDDCGEFEAPPRFLDLPLDGQPIEAITASIPPGTYDELEFEVEDLEDDESDPVLAAQIESLWAEIRSVVPDWPREASVQVSGSFAPTNGTSVSFRVLMEAEIEIEMDLVPALVVGEDGIASRDVTVDIAPAMWFMNDDGTVMDLTAYDFDATGVLLEFEAEIEDGFVEVDFDD